MIARRFASFLLAASLLNVNVSRADVACATHGARAPQGEQARSPGEAHHAMAMPAGHADHMVMSPVQNGASDRENCETPSQADCCQAMVTCSIVLGTVQASSPKIDLSMNARALTAATAVPLSRVTAPDPPPPRS